MKNIIATILCSIIFSLSLFPQNVDDLIAKHIEARGGAKNWEAVQSLKFTGRYTGFSQENEYMAIHARPNLYYADYHLGKYRVIEGYDGKTAWEINPWSDLNFPHKCYGLEKHAFVLNSEMETPFFNYKEKGYKVALSGKEKLDGIDVFKLELTKDNGRTETWYLDANTYLEYKRISDWHDFGMPFPRETYYDEFTTVKGLNIPFYIESEFGPRHRIIEIHKAEVNIEPDKRMFTMPLSEEMQKLQQLEGDWNVAAEIKNRAGNWMVVDSTTSSIQFQEANNLLQARIYYTILYPPTHEKTLNWTYHSGTNKYRLTVFDHLYSNLDVFEGDFEENILSVDNQSISFGESANENKKHERYVVKDISADGFVLEIAASMDKGANWSPREKFTYTRKK